MKAIVDRFEGDFAVCEVVGENRMINLEKALLSVHVKEGDVLSIEGIVISIDIDETEKRKIRINNLLDSLWE